MKLTGAERSRSLVDTLAVAAAVLASVAMIQLVTDSLPVTLAYAGGLVVLGLIAFATARRRPAGAAAAEREPPDWSVTVAAIEQPGLAVAITDRANRLLCANAAFELWFGSAHAPPRLPVDGASADQLARAARAAWREGEAEEITIGDETQTLSCSPELLLCNHQGFLGSMSFETRLTKNLYGKRDSYGGFYGPAEFGWEHQGGEEKARRAGRPFGLVNEWHGPAKAIVSVVGNRVYFPVGSQVICLEGR